MQTDILVLAFSTKIRIIFILSKQDYRYCMHFVLFQQCN